MKPSTPEAYRLLHDGSLALAEVEANGMRVDEERLDRMMAKCSEKIDKLQAKMEADEIHKAWLKTYGGKTNLGSRVQLGKVLFEVMGYESDRKTSTGRAKTDEESLELVDVGFVKDYLRCERLKKLRSTYLRGIKRELVDGMLRPSFNLHIATTFRSSSDSPNFQNLPIRDPEMGKVIRTCFIPRENHVLVEIDYSALEGRIAACFWRDPSMVEYFSDPSKDIHRDMAMECYKLSLDEMTKEARFYAKNQFVFPQLYGSYYVNCAKNLWQAIGRHNLKTAEGVCLYEHLKAHGIKRLGDCNPKEKPKKNTFEFHIRRVEKELAVRWPKWAVDRELWWRKYQRRGWFRLMTGFVIAGVFKKNDLMNWPIQGPAFHCLLWSLIKLVKWMKRNKMKSKIVGQIHDSIVADIHRSELHDCLVKAKQVMTEDVRKTWDWIITPLDVEVEVAETNWYEKKEMVV